MSNPNPYANHKVPTANGGLYLKLEDGQTVSLRLATEPYIYQSVFTQADGATKFSTRYAWVIFNHDENAAQVLQLSATTFKTIQGYANDEDYGDPTTYNLKITRNGTGTDTTYAIIASPKKTVLTPEQKLEVNKITLTNVKGLEHALPLSQVQDGNNAPKPALSVPTPATVDDGRFDNIKDSDNGTIDLDSIPF